MEDKKEIRRQALLEVIRFCGSIQAYSDRLELARGRVSYPNTDQYQMLFSSKI